MKVFVFFLAFGLSGVALAQQGGRNQGKQQMQHDDRQRMREDMNQVYRDRDRGPRPERPQRQMSPQEREKLRQDVREANKQLKR